MKRKLEIIIGLLFILATLTYMTGSSMITSTDLLEPPLPAIFLEMINNVSVFLIGLFFYMILKKNYKALGSQYFISRTLEAIGLTIGTLSLLSGSKSLYSIMFPIAMLALGLYSTYFFYQLYKEYLGPRLLNIIGVIGYICLTIYSLFNLMGIREDWTMVLFLPGAIFELVFPLFLIFKGYKQDKLA